MTFKIVYGNPIRYYVFGTQVDKKTFDKEHKKAARGRRKLKAGQKVGAISMNSKLWPRKSMAMGVGKHQIAEAEEKARKAGVPTEWCKETGMAIIRDNAHQRDLQKRLGLVNFDAGYGTITG